MISIEDALCFSKSAYIYSNHSVEAYMHEQNLSHITAIMELFLYCLLFISTFLLTKLLLTLKNPNPNLPPGPRKLPVIGSLHHLLGAELPHHALWALSKIHGPIMHLQLGQIPAVVVTSGHVAREFFKNHDISIASRPENIAAANVILYGPIDMLFAPFGEYYKKV